jgi:hypothetical protein
MSEQEFLQKLHELLALIDAQKVNCEVSKLYIDALTVVKDKDKVPHIQNKQIIAEIKLWSYIP